MIQAVTIQCCYSKLRSKQKPSDEPLPDTFSIGIECRCYYVDWTEPRLITKVMAEVLTTLYALPSTRSLVFGLLRTILPFFVVFVLRTRSYTHTLQHYAYLCLCIYAFLCQCRCRVNGVHYACVLPRYVAPRACWSHSIL